LKKPIIGVDLDDTVFEFMQGMITYHNRVYDAAHELCHFTTFDNIHDVWGCSLIEARRRVTEFTDSIEHGAISAVPGSIRALEMLSLEHEIVGITAREPTRAHVTLPLVKRLFGEIFSTVHFVGHKKEKGSLCEELGVRFMVDDGLHNARSVGARGISVFLLDRPWNQGDLPTSTMRVKHWDEIVRHLFSH
jgi:uncharacterized HAD superfamily protein